MLNLLLVDNIDLPLQTAYKFPHASPPIGLQYLAAYIKQHLPEVSSVKVMSLPLALLEQKRHPLDVVLEELRGQHYDMLGIRSLTSGRDFMEILSSAVKKEFPALPIIAGGPYASDSAALILKDHAGVDYTASQEGEEVLRQFIEARLLGRGEVEKVRGLGHRKGDQVVINPPMAWIDDVDTIPFPDYQHVHLDRFARVENPMRIANGETWTSLFTQRGCPYRCTYCHEGFGKLSRERSVKNVLDEIFWLHGEKGVTHFAILDDIFNIRKDRAKEIMRGVINSGIKVRFSFPNGLRGDIMDKELVDLMVAAGTVCIHYAVETAAPRLQKWIKKNMKMEKLDPIIDYTAQYDILLRGFYMVGFPDETEEELKATIDHAIRSRFTETYFSILCMWPGTKIYEAAVQDGFIPEGAWTSATSHDVKNNGFRYPDELMVAERLRGYGHTHFSKERMSRNLRICGALGIDRNHIIEKEVKYAQLLRDGWKGPGPIPYAPEPAIVDTLLGVGDGKMTADAAYDVIARYVAEGHTSQPGIQAPGVNPNYVNGGAPTQPAHAAS
ncbi:radical SAM protein [Corallococcus sp. AB011P]|uniref:B12-binding domain-containing radical SAM protein n=1 Tax=unclassified Corallococcus TaxID=2685029 RepID=UPI000EA07744|nr:MULTISPECIES: radical SAM protein [unclassified Corallococcus]RKG55471.1 radical SAM protein [Corallococcus sp. AB011P]RKH88285.1 radical SAM protein [Corallococcus sp. AB045]